MHVNLSFNLNVLYDGPPSTQKDHLSIWSHRLPLDNILELVSERRVARY